jgi:HAD superfamily hydrolase (TIGR01509 family)
MSAKKSLAAILFDFDGVLVDSEALHHRAYEIALAPFGVTGIPKDVYADRFSNRGVGMEYCAEIVPGIDLAALKERKEAAFRELLENDARLLPGAVEAVRALASSGTLALATGSRRAAVAGVLERFGFDRSFSAVVTREDYDRDKPAPDAFLRACQALGVEPAECLVIEDSYKGLRASVAAGIACVVVPNDYTREADFTGAVAVLSRLAELDRERADALFRASSAVR